MRKYLRKIGAAVLSLAMLGQLGITAWAAEGESEAPAGLVNLVPNGDMSSDDISMFTGGDSRTITTVDGKRVLEWSSNYEWGGLYYLYDFEAGHKYYAEVTAREVQQSQGNMTLKGRFGYTGSAWSEQASETAYPNKDLWITLSKEMTAPSPEYENQHALYLYSPAAGTKLQTYGWKLYDITESPKGSAGLVSSTPADGDTDCNFLDTNVELTFDKHIAPKTANGGFIIDNGAEIKSVELDEGLTKVTVELAGLKPDTEYTLSTADSLKTVWGEAVDAGSVSFTTDGVGDHTASLVSTTPADGAVNVAVETEVEAEFDMDIDADTFTADNIEVNPETEFTTSAEGRRGTITFTEPLASATEYTVTFKDGIESVYGTPLNEDSVTFTTAKAIEDIINNLVINSELSTDEGHSMYKNDNGKRFAEDPEKGSVLEWNAAQWDFIYQDCNLEPGHTYYAEMEVKANKAAGPSIAWQNITTENTMIYVADKSIQADTWYTLGGTLTISADKIHGTSREGFGLYCDGGTAGITVQTRGWRLYDITEVPDGDAVLKNSPQDGAAECVLTDMQVEMTFNRPLKPATLMSGFSVDNGAEVKSVKINDTLTKVTLILGDLKPNTTYTVSAADALKTLKNGSASANMSFTTYTDTADSINITDSTIADGAENVQAKNNVVRAAMNTYPDPATLTTENITADKEIIKEIRYSSDEPKTVYIDLKELAFDTEYKLSFGSGIKSVSGKAFDACDISFKTITIAKIIENYNTAVGADAAAVKAFLNGTNYTDLAMSCDLYDYLKENNKAALMDAVCERLVGKTASTTADIEKAVSLAAVQAVLGSSTDTADIEKALLSKSLGVSEAVKTAYNKIDDKTKFLNSLISSRITADEKASAEEKIITTALSYANGSDDVKTVIEGCKDSFPESLKLGDLISKVAASGKSSDIYSKLQNVKTATYSEIYNKLNDAYAKATAGASGNGGSGSSGNRGNGGSTGGGFSAGLGNIQQGLPEVKHEAFDDIGGVSWAKNSILRLYEAGVVSGREEGVFAPNENVKREECVRMIVSAAGFKADGDETDFADVDSGFWAHDYIMSAVANEIVSGMEGNKFGVGLNITREDAACMIYRTAQKMKYVLNTETEDFADIDDAAEYAKEAIRFLKASGIVSGYGDGTFMPKNNLTRAELAVILDRFLQSKPAK